MHSVSLLLHITLPFTINKWIQINKLFLIKKILLKALYMYVTKGFPNIESARAAKWLYLSPLPHPWVCSKKFHDYILRPRVRQVDKTKFWVDLNGLCSQATLSRQNFWTYQSLMAQVIYLKFFLASHETKLQQLWVVSPSSQQQCGFWSNPWAVLVW